MGESSESWFLVAQCSHTKANEENTMTKLHCIFATIAFALAGLQGAYANPAPFGLEIGKTTPDMLQKEYRAEQIGINQYSSGPMYSVSPSEVGFEGLKELTLIFSRDHRLHGVLATLPKNRFDRLYEMLRGKYQLVSKDIPFVGSKSVEFRDGQTEVRLNAPHMSFEMTMHYLHEDLLASFERQRTKEQQAKRQRESGQL